MMDVVQARGTALQRQLSEFLYAETLHTLGSYKPACEKSKALQRELEIAAARKGEGEDSLAEEVLGKAAAAGFRCNDHLRKGLHRPMGLESERFLGRRPTPFSEKEEEGERKDFAPDAGLLAEIATFYGDAEVALRLLSDDPAAARRADAPGATLGEKFSFIHDPQRRGRFAYPPPGPLVEGKIIRTQARLAEVRAQLDAAGATETPAATGDAARAVRFQRLLDSHTGGNREFLATIVAAFNEAHMWMHKAENVLAQNFGEVLKTIPKTHSDAQRMLRYSHNLNTFVFVTARAVPWVFAEDDAERQDVIEDYANCCDRLAPTYCMWIAAQFSLLALHRRAYTSWTMGNHEDAYRDFHKLTRLLRGLRNPAQKRGLRVPGTNTFIEGMTAMSELHIGRIYRGKHAYRMALRYFKRSSRHLSDWEEDDEIGPLIKSSHWRINLLLNQGKANFELGRHKRSILHYARAWRAFLLLVQSETHATANTDVVNEFIKWLDPIVDEPELSRRELRDRIEPLVEQLVTLRTPVHLRLLAADIVMRMGHLLFIMRLPYRALDRRTDDGPRQRHHHLASECIEQALFLDPTSTLAAGDRLKIEEARRELEEVEMDVAGEEALERLIVGNGHRRRDRTPLADQWPSGSGLFEDTARITELTLQEWLTSASRADADSPGGVDERLPDQEVARGLLGSFLAHTDSSNMKLAQVYSYLMRAREPKPLMKRGQYALDFVCLRRYSSFFPFLPRPAAFRAPGGGYFVEVAEPGRKPFGIAIDPGPDFIENLYACGYSLGDIHMILLTHDHADHMASVDALLALMGNRRGLGDPTFDQEKGECLAIVGNASVRRRYSHFGRPHPVKRDPDTEERAPRRDAVRVLSYSKIAAITRLDEGRSEATKEAEILRLPAHLRIEPVKTWGHTDANGYVSQGFMLRFGPRGNEASILFTGDTGEPEEGAATGEESSKASRRLFAAGSKDFWDAVEEADVVVAHVSAVPLRELRTLANLGEGDEVAAQMIDEYTELWATAAEQARSKGGDDDEVRGAQQTEFLLNQIQFGFRSRPNKRGKDLGVSPFADLKKIRKQPEQHLYLTGLIEVARRMASDSERAPLLLIGELREELGTFRTQIARRIRAAYFGGEGRGERPSALTADIGLRVRLSRSADGAAPPARVLCTTCDLDNDLMPSERFHEPAEIHELCVKGEDEGVFYNCSLHDPRTQRDDFWVESVERYNVFGD